jgi:hypothetical protein
VASSANFASLASLENFTLPYLFYITLIVPNLALHSLVNLNLNYTNLTLDVFCYNNGSRPGFMLRILFLGMAVQGMPEKNSSGA